MKESLNQLNQSANKGWIAEEFEEIRDKGNQCHGGIVPWCQPLPRGQSNGLWIEKGSQRAAFLVICPL
jgi:hypothetical protein